MNNKPGRNDPCPCGSGKKYKACCMAKQTGPKKLKAKWINAPSGQNLVENVFGQAIHDSEKKFKPIPKTEESQ